MGRNINFDKHLVIEQITNLFWKKGFNNTSLKDIEDTTNVKKASLHRFFGINKEELFNNSLEHYFKKSSARWSELGQGVEFLDAFFKNLLDQAKSKKDSDGCLVMNTVLEFAPTTSKKHNPANRYFEKVRAKLKKEITFELKKNNCNGNTDKLSKSYMSLAFSIRELSKITNDPSYYSPIEGQLNALNQELGC
ncbi:MAG: helix-turn-helix transcriptional regulator [Bacteriovoracaceae bacterium]|nr:helix-turn-helix transcriptional regulator [Bacteriovoracaceae bacterium]